MPSIVSEHSGTLPLPAVSDIGWNGGSRTQTPQPTTSRIMHSPMFMLLGLTGGITAIVLALHVVFDRRG